MMALEHNNSKPVADVSTASSSTVASCEDQFGARPNAIYIMGPVESYAACFSVCDILILARNLLEAIC